MARKAPTVVLKVDVDTERGTRRGVPLMAAMFKLFDIQASFLFSLGPDNTGRAIRRVFRRGFLNKVSRTSIVSVYGVRTLLNGVVLPGPRIAKRHAKLMRRVKEAGFEVGIHCYDHVRWQDGVTKMPQEKIAGDFQKAVQLFTNVFDEPPRVAGAPGWQANAKTLQVYDDAGLTHASDARGACPFFPRVGDVVYKTLQIPTTMPTLDELIGRPEFPMDRLIDYYSSQLELDRPNIFTVHAEIEGMKYRQWFSELLRHFKKHGVQFKTLNDIATEQLAHREEIPVCELLQGTVHGRSGTLALQGYDDKDEVFTLSEDIA